LEAEEVCPMCEQQVPAMSVKISDDPASDFKALISLMKDAPDKNEDDAEEREDFDSDEDERDLL